MNDQMSAAEGVSTARLYGASIGVVSGVYSLFQATTGAGMSGSAWFMAALGAVVLVHGVVLVTPATSALGRASGPLMIAYSVLMLVNQAWLASTFGDGMAGGGMNDGGMMDGGSMNDGMQSGMDAASAMGADAGMVAIAALMLASGVIMTRRESGM
ncbi:hypothetical protein [Halobacterium rubrum]|uniref:hypothetical protein n=1 Tax=Halobacterium TaxID=2239 RepID=UPI001F3AAAE6|nr:MULTISPECIES: hypothetical protein [Halobacterium]MDH5020329.1 hypothetical protein [Halobacterium rubrum]